MRRGPHLGAPPRQRTPCLSTARESNPALLLGRQGPQPLGQRYERNRNRIERERAPRVELGPSDWQSGMQPQTPCARGGQGRNRTDSYRGCNPAPSHLATWPCRGDGANRTRATVVGLGLANRPVTAPARLPSDSVVPPGGFEPPKPAFVALAASNCRGRGDRCGIRTRVSRMKAGKPDPL